jgi:hypothetical protein
MRASMRHACVALMTFVWALAGCGGGGSSGSASPTTDPSPVTVVSAPPSASAQPLISLSSDSGDYIGQGSSYAYDSSNAVIRLTARGANLQVQVDGRESWTATFQLPGLVSRLEPGTYASLGRFPFQPVGEGAMDWSGQGRGCNVLRGDFTIHAVAYDVGILQSIDLSFEQHCEGLAPALRGRIHVDAAAMGAVAPPQNALPSQPVVALTSDGGDYIGGGAIYAYDRATASVVVQAEGGHLQVQVVGDERWLGDFQMPGGAATLAPGTYGQLVRYPTPVAGAGSLSWWGESRGCNTSTGTVTIHAVGYDPAGALTSLDMEFQQHCEGSPAALRGRITWDASLPLPPPGPAPSAPAGLWQPPAGAMPDSSIAMYIASDWNDYIGAGSTYWVGGQGAPAGTPTGTQGTVKVTMSETAGLLTLGVAGTVNWRAEFKAMDGLARLQPGYYGIVERYPFHNPRRGGMNFSMESRGCNQLSGWFMIDSVSYRGDQLASIDLRFAQHCENGLSALRGRIRWAAS